MSPGDRIVVPALVLEIGQLQEVVQVKAEAPLVQASSGERSFTVTTDAVQVFGGVGYTRDYRVERYMREAKVTQIFEGTNQIQRMVIGRDLLR